MTKNGLGELSFKGMMFLDQGFTKLAGGANEATKALMELVTALKGGKETKSIGLKGAVQNGSTLKYIGKSFTPDAMKDAAKGIYRNGIVNEMKKEIFGNEEQGNNPTK